MTITNTDGCVATMKQEPLPARSVAVMPINTDNELTLPDGRRLGYAAYGPEDGWPILFFHGIPGSRHSSHSAGLVGETHGARVIAFDRPGYGLSDPRPGRQIHHWPEDVGEALDVLGIDRFSVFGYSGGGPFAMATAVAMPDRVASLTNVSAMGPVYTPEAELRLTRRQRLKRFVGANVPAIVRFQSWRAARSIRRDVGAFLAERAAGAADEDRMQIERPAINAVMRQDLLASVRRGGGTLAHEMRLMARPWQFDLTAVRAPMQIWHGTDDGVVPLWLAESVASRIPHAETRYLSDLGHLLLLSHMSDIIEQLLESRAEPAAITDEPEAAASAAS